MALPPVAFNDAAKRFFKTFELDGFSTVSIADLTYMLPTLSYEDGTTVVLFNKYPILDTKWGSLLTCELLSEFIHKRVFTTDFELGLEEMLNFEKIVFVVIMDAKDKLIGLTNFVSTDKGHLCVLLGVDRDKRSNGFGK